MASGTITPIKTLGGDVNKSGGTTDHNKLNNRDQENQHPISAITGLEEALKGQETEIADVVAATEKAQATANTAIKKTDVLNQSIKKVVEEEEIALDRLKTDLENTVNQEIDANKQYTHDELNKLDDKLQNKFNADVNKLDQKIDSTANIIRKEVDLKDKQLETLLSNKIKQESTDRQLADNKLATDIENARKEATDNLNQEKLTRLNADKKLQENIDGNTKLITDLTASVKREISRLDAADEHLATTIKETQKTLEKQLQNESERAKAEEKRLEDKLDTEIEARQVAVKAEQDARIAKDTALGQAILNEETNRVAAIDAEQKAREDADTALETKIDTLIKAEEDARKLAIEAETEARIAADEALDKKVKEDIKPQLEAIEKEISDLEETIGADISTKISGLQKDLADEAKARTDADETLTANIENAIKAEEEARTKADAELRETVQKDIEPKLQNIENSISELEKSINEDISKTVEEIQNSLSEEATARENADKTLTEDINNAVSDINNSIADITNDINNAIADEISARTDADSTLDQKIDDVYNAVGEQVIEIAKRAEAADKILDEKIAALANITIEKVDQLPETGKSNIIYLVPHKHDVTDEKSDTFDEFLYIDNKFELIGNTDIDLSSYYDKTEIDGLLDSVAEGIGNNVVELATRIENKFTEVEEAIEAEESRATAAEEALQAEIEGIQERVSLEGITKVSAERFVGKESELISANFFEPDAEYYEYKYIANENDYYGTWRWKLFDPDMLIYNPRYRMDDYLLRWAVDWVKFDYPAQGTGGASPRRESRLCAYDIYDGSSHQSELNGIMYGWRFAEDTGWDQGDWVFHFDNNINRTGWYDKDQRIIRFYDHKAPLGYVRAFAEKLSDDILPMPVNSALQTWTKVNLTEADFLRQPTKYRKRQLNSINSTKLIKATTYSSSTEYYTRYTDYLHEDELRGTWYIDKDPLELDYQVKGWYFMLNTEETCTWGIHGIEDAPVFDGFIIEKSEDGQQLIVKRYGTCKATSEFDSDHDTYGYWYSFEDTVLSTPYVIYDKNSGWIDERFRYIGIAQQYSYRESTRSELVEDYSLKNFVTQFGHKISDRIIGANEYTIEDFNQFLDDNYRETPCYKKVGKVSITEFMSGEYFEIETTEPIIAQYTDIVRFAIDSIDNKDTVIRGATGQDVIRIADDNAIVNNYFPLAPNCIVDENNKVDLLLENSSEFSLPKVTSGIIFRIPTNVQHGYCSSVVIICDETVTELPSIIINNSKYPLQIMQSGNVVEKLEMFGNCQYNLLFMCNGINLELYIQETTLG